MKVTTNGLPCDDCGGAVRHVPNCSRQIPPEAMLALAATPDKITDICHEIATEVKLAQSIHAPINSVHEGYAVILEELDEFKEEVWKKSANRDPAKMRKELIQTAAMCVRTINDVIEQIIEKQMDIVFDKPTYQEAGGGCQGSDPAHWMVWGKTPDGRSVCGRGATPADAKVDAKMSLIKK